MSVRIGIFRALYLGDLLFAVPALRALRRQFPEAEMTLIGLPWAKSFVRRYRSYLDRFVEFPGYPGINEVEYIAARTQQFLDVQRRYGYDLVIQMHGSGGASNPFVLALGSSVTAGYYEDTPAGLTRQAPYPHEAHEVMRNLGLAAMVGCRELSPALEFPLYAEDEAEAAALLSRFNRHQQPWIAIHAGARSPARRWPPDYFAAVADELVRRYDALILLTGGPDEASIVDHVARHMTVPGVNLVGQTSLGGLAALMKRLTLFISNDTGPAHIAEAVGTPSITVFGPAEYTRWAPLDQARHVVVRHPVACSPCGYWECPIDHRCLRRITPERVIRKAAYIFQKETSPCDA